MAPMTRKTTVPNIDNNSGAFSPKAILPAISSEGSSNPSWAQRNGRTRFFWTLAILPSGKSLSPKIKVIMKNRLFGLSK